MLAAVMMQDNQFSAQEMKECQKSWHAMERAAILAFAGNEAEAEATRWTAGYHNLCARVDADCVTAP